MAQNPPKQPVNPQDYMVYPNFPGTESQTAASVIPYLIPPFLLKYFYPAPPLGPTAIQVAVANVFGANSQTANCQLIPPAGPPYSQSDFTLSWDASVQSSPVLQVLISPANVWQVNPTARQTLAANFVIFCSWLDNLENLGCFARGGAFVVAQRVAQAMPLSIAETLQYFYGFNAQKGYIDLQPGMRLRVEFEVYDNVSNLNPNLNSFLGNGSAHYYLCSKLSPTGIPMIAFDAFLGANRSPSIFRNTQGAGGVIDLEASGVERRYYRLFYPTSMVASNLTPGLSTTNNVTLIGANSLADLTIATTTYLQNGTCAASSSNSIICTFFNGRAIVIPEVLINIGGIQTGNQNINGEQIYVPIGTTVRNLVDRMANWCFGVNNLGVVGSGNIQLQRLFTATQPGQQGNNPVGIPQAPTYQQMEFTASAKVPAIPFIPDIFDLPVCKGDVLSLVGI